MRLLRRCWASALLLPRRARRVRSDRRNRRRRLGRSSLSSGVVVQAVRCGRDGFVPPRLCATTKGLAPSSRTSKERTIKVIVGSERVVVLFLLLLVLTVRRGRVVVRVVRLGLSAGRRVRRGGRRGSVRLRSPVERGLGLNGG